MITKLFLQQSKVVDNNLRLLQTMKSGYNYNIDIIEEDKVKNPTTVSCVVVSTTHFEIRYRTII